MSGGHFDYNQNKISEISDEILRCIYANKELEKSDGLEKAYAWSPKTIKELENAIHALKVAYVYANRIDWLLSDDDSEETFHKRLKEDMGGL